MGRWPNSFGLRFTLSRWVKNLVPNIVKEDEIDQFHLDEIEDRQTREKLSRMFNRLAEGRPFFERNQQYREFDVNNMWFSRCYNCDDISLWIYDKLIYPQRGEAPEPNPDLPNEIRRDYDEASSILDLSPRGAAALIRLCIQKLCTKLGQPGKNINDDIGALVTNGLDSRVQKALDAVRVIGNNAVHPGQIDLKDDRATAETLFKLLNLIAEKMISEPKHVDDVYGSLPPEALEQIKKRDDKKSGQ